MSARLIDVAAVAPQRWKNGAGVTRELAVQPAGADMDHFDWRISVAQVARDGPFSVFAGVDRCITLLRGAGMTLASADNSAHHRLDVIGEPFAFAGDLPVAAHLIDGACEDLNVMVRRGRARAEVTVIDAAADIAAADAGLILCIGGRWRCTGHDAELHPMQALLWQQAMPAGTLAPLQSGSRALLVRLRSLCQDGSP